MRFAIGVFCAVVWCGTAEAQPSDVSVDKSEIQRDLDQQRRYLQEERQYLDKILQVCISPRPPLIV